MSTWQFFPLPFPTLVSLCVSLLEKRLCEVAKDDLRNVLLLEHHSYFCHGCLNVSCSRGIEMDVLIITEPPPS
ncbi:hypothetical protein CPB83DRAFT_843203 [Crepidotus variabilis]|uniref:Secreted protein n=1 Tax=Crepidotus variabilis TaxID=179855 RepID=A0A9P6EU61_9AGAR|nr:hypothetical protein CPB83DRAFT_843203 [Crepidotus variabilis]